MSAIPLFASGTPHPAAAALACLLIVTGAGCRLMPRRGPVPQEVADARKLCNEGLSAVDRQDLVRAESLLERAVKQCPTDVDARRHYADVLWQRGERMEAVRQIAGALRLSPGDVPLCIDGGRMYMELGLLDDADRLSADAIHAAPNSAAAWRLHAQVALARGRAEEALADFHRALAIHPDDREVLFDTADVYRRLGRPQRALATLAVLGESYGPTQTPPEVFRLEGLALEDLDRPVDALECYRQAAARGAPQTEMAARIARLEERLAAERPQAVMAAGGPDAARR